MPKVTARLKELFAELKPDAVHAHNIHTYLTYQSLTIARQFTENIILTAHDTFAISFARVRGPRYEQSALSGTALRMHWWEHLLSCGRKYWPPRNRAIRRILTKSCTTVVAISHATETFLQANGIPVHAVIPNGIDPPPTPPADRNTRRPTVLFAGRIREDKGVAALLDAFARVLEEVPDAALLFVGEEKRLLPFIRSVQKNVQKSVQTTGWIPPEEMPLAYASADVVAVPSLYLDNFPTVNLEAMAAGKPVVGTCFGGTPEAVIDGETGFIVNPRDVDAYAQALVTLLTKKEMAEQMGKAGRKRLEESFTLSAQVNAYLSLLSR